MFPRPASFSQNFRSLILLKISFLNACCDLSAPGLKAGGNATVPVVEGALQGNGFDAEDSVNETAVQGDGVAFGGSALASVEVAPGDGLGKG